MRSFRNTLGTIRLVCLAVGAGVLASCGQPDTGAGQNVTASEELPAATAPPAPAPPRGDTDYFPLAAGNRWAYQCFAEGEAQLEKSTEVVGPATVRGQAGFLMRYVVNGEATEGYLWEDTAHVVYRSVAASGEGAEPIIARTASIGDSFGALRATRMADEQSPATGTVSALVLENFDFEDPALTQERRMAWQGRFFVSGVGLIAEGDGLGSECALVEFSVR